MIDDNWDLTPIIGAKLLRIRVRDNEVVAYFDNGRTLTTMLSLNYGDMAVEPKADLICGYHNDEDKKSI